MGSIEYSAEPAAEIAQARRDVMDIADAPAGSESDDPLAAARGVTWALVFGVLAWVGLYLLWRVMFR